MITCFTSREASKDFINTEQKNNGIDKASSASKPSWQAHYNAECEPGVTFETEWPGVSISDAADNMGNMVCGPLPAVLNCCDALRLAQSWFLIFLVWPRAGRFLELRQQLRWR
eukprot:1303277-Rhodomonas_salina.1